MKEYRFNMLILGPVKSELFPWPVVLQGQVAGMFVVPLAAEVAAVDENTVAVLALLKSNEKSLKKAHCASFFCGFVLCTSYFLFSTFPFLLYSKTPAVKSCLPATPC